VWTFGTPLERKEASLSSMLFWVASIFAIRSCNDFSIASKSLDISSSFLGGILKIGWYWVYCVIVGATKQWWADLKYLLHHRYFTDS
jgi:hypothetical protein